MSLQAENFYYGKGELSIAVRDPVTKVLGAWRYVGDVSALSVKPTVQMVQHKESHTGQNALVRNFPSETAVMVDFTLAEFRPDNLALALYGKSVATVTGTVTAEAMPDALVVGDVVRTAHPGVSALVITDAAATPVTLVEGVDYDVNLTFGRITILNIGSYTQPFSMAYSYAKNTATGLFTAAQPDIALLYEGINNAENGAGVVVELYKVAPSPLTELMLITTGNDTATLAVSAGVLLDTTKAANGPLGQFGSITQVGVGA